MFLHDAPLLTSAVDACIPLYHRFLSIRGVLLEIYAKASFSQNPWVRSGGWDGLPLPSTSGSEGPCEVPKRTASEETIQGASINPVRKKVAAVYARDRLTGVSRVGACRVVLNVGM